MKCVFVLYLIRLRWDNSIGESTSFRTISAFLWIFRMCAREPIFEWLMVMCVCPCMCARVGIWSKKRKVTRWVLLTLKWHPCLSRIVSIRIYIHTHTTDFAHISTSETSKSRRNLHAVHTIYMRCCLFFVGLASPSFALVLGQTGFVYNTPKLCVFFIAFRISISNLRKQRFFFSI